VLRSKTTVWTALLAVTMVCGCIVVRRGVVRYDVKRETLDGKMYIEYQGIHSTADSEADQEREMAEFYREFEEKGDFGGVAAKAKTIYALKNVETKLTRREELRADAMLSGEFKSFAQAFLGLADSYGWNYSVSSTENVLTVHASPASATDEVLEGCLIIEVRYEGTVIEHNADEFDQDTKIMRWNVRSFKPNKGLMLRLAR